MSIVRFDPFNTLLHSVNRLCDPARSGEVFYNSPLPPVDIYETETALELTADLPGVASADLDVRVENNRLTIAGTRQQESEVKQEGLHRAERAYGSVARSFTVPSWVDAEKISATYTNGVLKVVLPKREESKPKTIKVQVQ